MSLRFQSVCVALALVLAALALFACTGDQPAKREPATPVTHGDQLAAEEAAPAPTTTKQADADLAAARKLAADLRRDVKAADEHVRALETERDQIAVDAARARLAWTAGLLQLAVIGFAALAIFSPVGRTWAVTAACGAEAAAVLALALRSVYAYLPAVGCVLGVVFVVIAVWHIRKAVRAARAAADHGDRMEAALLGLKNWFTGDESLLHDLVASVKVESAKAQWDDGVGNILARIRGVDPAHSATMASLPIIRAKVSELPAKVIPELVPHDAPPSPVVALTSNRDGAA